MPAQTLAGSCNDPTAQYTVCPDGGGDTMPLRAVAGGSAAALATACDQNKQCVGFLAWKPGGGGVLLRYGYGGNSYAGYTSYTRIPQHVVPAAQ